MIPIKDFRETAIRFHRYTGLNLNEYIDHLLTWYFKYIVFKMDKYLDYCESNGLKDDESIEEFNLRFYIHGDRVNSIMRKMIE